jgi:hypothetical protein
MGTTIGGFGALSMKWLSLMQSFAGFRNPHNEKLVYRE